MAFDKVYEVLTHSPCQFFNSEIVVYKQTDFAAIDVHRLLIKAQEEYRQLVSKQHIGNLKFPTVINITPHQKKSKYIIRKSHVALYIREIILVL